MQTNIKSPILDTVNAGAPQPEGWNVVPWLVEDPDAYLKDSFESNRWKSYVRDSLISVQENANTHFKLKSFTERLIYEIVDNNVDNKTKIPISEGNIAYRLFSIRTFINFYMKRDNINGEIRFGYTHDASNNMDLTVFIDSDDKSNQDLYNKYITYYNNVVEKVGVTLALVDLLDLDQKLSNQNLYESDIFKSTINKYIKYDVNYQDLHPVIVDNILSVDLSKYLADDKLPSVIDGKVDNNKISLSYNDIYENLSIAIDHTIKELNGMNGANETSNNESTYLPLDSNVYIFQPFLISDPFNTNEAKMVIDSNISIKPTYVGRNILIPVANEYIGKMMKDIINKKFNRWKIAISESLIGYTLVIGVPEDEIISDKLIPRLVYKLLSEV